MMIQLNPEAQKAADTLVMMGMERLRAEQVIWELGHQWPHADAIALTTMALDAQKRDLSFGVQNPAKLALKAGFGWTLGEGLAQYVFLFLFLGGLAIVGSAAIYIFLILMARD